MTIIQGECSEYRPLVARLEEHDFGLRLDIFLSRNYPFLTRSQWQRKIAKGDVRVNRTQVRPSYRLSRGDRFEMHHPVQNEPEVDGRIYPIFKRGLVMAVYKPGNLPMHENGPYRNNTFARLLADEVGPDWAAVHRLDRETSGLVLCGRTNPIRQELARLLATREVEKEYLAVVKGRPSAHSFIEKGPIGDLVESSIRIKKWVSPAGQPAETHFKVLEEKEGHALISARPKTGRTNQIRIHAAYNGLPIVGDKLYHPDESVFEDYFKNRSNTKFTIEKTGFHRLCLHAYRLKFRHPELGNTCEIISPLPEDISQLWNSMGSSTC